MSVELHVNKKEPFSSSDIESGLSILVAGLLGDKEIAAIRFFSIMDEFMNTVARIRSGLSLYNVL